ncbi:MAG TPA: aminotransferase class V-fold PLP-dependent enzyme [Gemmatimonadaceae bacterium]|nr:aminotransferase class V-fold PLP-dependent enzyme [Gemmatimonadaceae bacterium]
MTPDLTAIREREFPWAARGDATFLDHASTGPLPMRTRRVIDAQGLKRAEPFRLTADDLFPQLQRARDHAATLIGAPPGSVALVTNTSHGVNIAARTLPFGAGDVILSTAGEFPANVYPWLAAARARGAEFRMLPLADGLPDEATILRAIAADPRVRGVALSWVSFWSGYRFDLDAIGAACRAAGKWFFVDAIQGVGAAELDVMRAQVDILSCGAQKWLLSPWGTGFCYVRPGLITTLEPAEVGWMAQPATADFARFLDYDPAWYEDARRFEVVTLDFVHFAAMAESIGLFLEVTPAAAAASVRALADRIVAFATTNGVPLATPRDPGRRAGVVSLRPRQLEAASARLKADRISHSVREGCLRLAPHFYNTAAEVDRALELIQG